MRKWVLGALLASAAFAAALFLGGLLYAVFLLGISIAGPLLGLDPRLFNTNRLLGGAVYYFFVLLIPLAIAAGVFVLAIKGQLPGTRSGGAAHERVRR